MISKAICPYCKEELRIEMTAQFVDRVNPSVMEMYSEELNRMQNRASGQGRMMKMAAGMAKGMQSTMMRAMQGMVEFPPMVTILKCMSCDAALAISLPSND